MHCGSRGTASLRIGCVQGESRGVFELGGFIVEWHWKCRGIESPGVFGKSDMGTVMSIWNEFGAQIVLYSLPLPCDTCARYF